MNDQFEKDIQNSLRNSEESMDQTTIDQLVDARKAAVKNANTVVTITPKNFPLRAVAASLALVVGVLIFQNNYQGRLVVDQTNMTADSTTTPLLINTNTEILSESIIHEDVELYDNLEFYQWLSDTEHLG